MNLDWPALETERLILRPWKPEDFEPYARFSADEESMRYLGRDGRPTDAAETWRTICLFLGHWYLRGYTLPAALTDAADEVRRRRPGGREYGGSCVGLASARRSRARPRLPRS